MVEQWNNLLKTKALIGKSGVFEKMCLKQSFRNKNIFPITNLIWTDKLFDSFAIAGKKVQV